ncbi:MAG: S8 family serine peptidase, partial [Bdellovibrionales bacterium]|nr:S8 family serine peptidase [Bdellovibrionales bacterium]
MDVKNSSLGRSKTYYSKRRLQERGPKKESDWSFIYQSLLLIALLIAASACGKKDNPTSPGDFPVLSENGTFQPEPTRYLVKYKTPQKGEVMFGARAGLQNPARVTQLREMAGNGGKAEALRSDLYRIKLGDPSRVGPVLESLRSSGEVEYVEPDQPVRAFFDPNDPKKGSQWAHNMVKSFQAWDIGKGSQDIVVAVIDTGVDYTHEDLKDNMWKNPDEIAGNGKDDDGNGLVDDVYGWDFVNGDNEPISDDSHFHGSHCAGIVGAVGDNGKGVIGMSPTVKIMALKFLGGDGSGSTGDAVVAIDYAISKGVKIMSNSWGSSQGSQSLHDAVKRASDAGILFVAAAGNDSQNNDRFGSYPANYNEINMISVAATDENDNMASFSSYGANSVHVGAPGVNILSTVNNNSYANLSGTSMATPLVAGLAALLWSERPELNFWDIKAAIMENVDKTPAMQGRVISNGRISALKSMQAMADWEARPKPEPGDDPPPGGGDPTGVARAPLLAGQSQLVLSNPQQPVPITFDISEFPDAIGGYIEVSRPNTPFQNPNDVRPDPYALTHATRQGK